jgi:hypothetical protein
MFPLPWRSDGVIRLDPPGLDAEAAAFFAAQ